jgi:predicted Na+-dependent transporter
MDLSIPVALLHAAAFSMGYFICKGLGFNEKTCRTVSIETGARQNWPLTLGIRQRAALRTSLFHDIDMVS